MESLRRFLNPLVLNLQKMELELTCPVCLKLLSAPTMLPCYHTSCSKCATTPTTNGYSCAICKSAYRSQDLRPASHLEAIVSIHRRLSSTVSTMVQQQDTQVHIPVTKTASQGTPESGNRSGVDKSDQMKSFNPFASKLVYNQSTGPAFGNMDGVQARDPAFENKAADAAVAPAVFVQGGSSGSQSSDGPGDLDCDSNDLEGELIASRSPLQAALKREPNGMGGHTRELKRQKSIDQGERQPTMSGAWKCEFCHSFKITEFTGPLSHYLQGEPLEADQAWKSNVLHVHEKCIEWAPQAFFTGDIANNLEPELARASKIKCSICGLKGAALGCLVKSCRKSYHVPCAHKISGCRWDEENFVMLCPSHSSKKLPCERLKSKMKTKLQQPSSDMIHDNLNSPSPMQRDKIWTDSPFLTSEWVICGSALNGHEKEILDQFEHQTGITVTNNWRSDVTHVIANTDERGACARTLKVLMAILAGKWVLSVNWLKACIEAREPVPEEPYEISSDVHGSFDGPRTGRLLTMQQAPSLFAGLTFYFSGHFMPAYKVHLEDLIAAAGGSILEKTGLSSTSLIVYSMEPPQGSDPDTLNEAIKKRIAEAEELAATIGCKAIPHTWLLDSIASCTVQLTV
ncbi:BRCA1-associated RING domain protein 1-like [Phragmites australis]|uniref:BRCA1-associated RING domain protein 1-like n=1 Tax=Phragmites australis TaxID=29695 RepID=UPI002D76C5CC|nr:BRCA1-associated RING domain protein 1-like [Phragmites australis]